LYLFALTALTNFVTVHAAVELSNINAVPGASNTDYDYLAGVPFVNGHRIVRDTAGVLHAVYSRTAAGITNIIYARSNTNGVSWSGETSVAVGNANTFLYHPSIEIDTVNPPNIYIVYSSFNNLSNESRTFIINGNGISAVSPVSSFGAPIDISAQLAALGTPYTIPTIAAPSVFDNYLQIDNVGTLHLAWSYSTGGDTVIYHAYSANGSVWNYTTTPFNTAVASNSDRHPRMSVNLQTNQIELTWMGNRVGGATYPSDGIVAFASRTPGVGGTWGAMTQYDAGVDMGYPDIIVDSAGNRHLTFTSMTGGNETIVYRQNTGALINVSATNAELKFPFISLTQNEVPVIFFWNNPSSFDNATFYSSSKLSPTQWVTPLLQSPVGRMYGTSIPAIQNDILSMIWFARVAPNALFTIYAEDTDRIPPYQPNTPNLTLLTSNSCTADAFASIASMPAGATQVDFRLLKISGSGPAYDVSSGFQAALSFTFSNAPVGATYELTIRAQDAALNNSVYSASANLVIPASGTCVSFQVTRPPLVPAAGPTCAINNFISTDWTDNDPFDTLPTDAQNSFYIDNDNVDTNGVFQIGVGNNQPIAVASRLAGPISEDDETDSTILNLTGAPDNIYFVYGQMIGTVAGTVTSHSSVSFTKNSALNEIPQIVITAPSAAASAPVAGIFNIQYNYTSVAIASTVSLYYDPDNDPNNSNHTLIQGGIVVGPTPGINPGVAVPWNTSTIQSGTYYIRAEIISNSGSGCTSVDYSGGTVQFNNPITNSFGQRIYNFPNPFSPMTANPYQSTTNIVIALDSPSDVNLYIFNTHGQMIYRQDIVGVTTRFPNFVWDGRDSRGNIVPNGVYIMKALVRNTREVYSGRMSVLDK